MKYYKLEEIPIIKLENIHEIFDKPEWLVFKIENLFDYENLVACYNTVCKKYDLKSKDNIKNYSGYCLQSSEFDNDPLYDQLDAVIVYDSLNSLKVFRKLNSQVSHQTEIGKYFPFVFETFNPFLTLLRGRILSAKKGLLLRTHCDAPQSATLHIPILSNLDSHIVIDGKEFYLKPDGSAYLLNTTKFHFMYNAGPNDRLHIIFTLPPTSFKKLLPLDKEKFSRYLRFSSNQNDI